MPKLNDHGLGGGSSKSLGVPVYPLNVSEVLQKDDTNGTFRRYFGDETTEAPDIIQHTSCCSIGDEIYFMGINASTTGALYCYKYNVKTKIWSRLSDSPTNIRKYWAVSIGTTIYYGTTEQVYMYDVVTDTHCLYIERTAIGTKNSVVFMSCFAHAGVCSDGIDTIYIYGGNADTNFQKIAFKLTVSTTTYEFLPDMPVSKYTHGCVYGDDGYIYLMGGQGSNNQAYKYDIVNKTYTALTNIPFGYYLAPIVKVDNYIHLIHTQHVTTLYVYAYDILNNTYTQVANAGGIRRANTQGIVIDDVIYTIGGTTEPTTGDEFIILKVSIINEVVKKLYKNSKCYTDGDVIANAIKEICGKRISIGGITLEKVNGSVKIPADGDYALVGSNYATIGG